RADVRLEMSRSKVLASICNILTGWLRLRGNYSWASPSADLPATKGREMSAQEDLYNAVASIESPLFVGRTLGELGLVRSVSRKLTGKARVELTLPAPNPPGSLEERLENALRPYANGADIDVEVMDDDEAKTWMDGLKAKAGPG